MTLRPSCATLLVLALALLAVGPTGAGEDHEAISAAFVYVESIGETGWTYQHDQGRQCLARQGVKTAYAESVPETAYLRAIDMVRKGRFKAGESYGDLGDGTVSLAPLHTAVPESVRQRVETKRQALIGQTFDYWQGPLQTNNGKIAVAAGHTVTIEDINQMNWLLAGIEGTLP